MDMFSSCFDHGLTLRYFMVTYAFIWGNQFKRHLTMGNNLQQMTILTIGLCLYKNFTPRRGDSNEHPLHRVLFILMSTYNIGFL